MFFDGLLGMGSTCLEEAGEHLAAQLGEVAFKLKALWGEVRSGNIHAIANQLGNKPVHAEQ